MNDTPLYAQVALPIPGLGLLSYAVPDALAAACRPGCLVLAPVGRRKLTGVVWQLANACDYVGTVRPLEAVLGERPLLDERLRHLLEWISRYYLQPIGLVLALALPAHLDFHPRRRAVWRGGRAAVELAEPLAALAATLRRRKGGLTLETLVRHHGAQGLDKRLAELVALGLVSLEEQWLPRHAVDPEADAAPAEEAAPVLPPPALTDEQEVCVQALTEAVAGGNFVPFLLEGVTGSGKTEVYFRAVEACLAQGRQALLLVPEIALTPQLVRRYRKRFGAGLAVFHSGLSDRQRFDHWQAMVSGRARVAVGARSALFAPAPDLGLLVVDEEHDGSYKQSEGVPYHARDMAVVRARAAGAVLVLGSATPSLESLYNAGQGKYRHLRLLRRATGAALPPVELIRLGDPAVRADMPPGALITPPLLEAVAAALGRGEQALLFLNRRGYAPSVLCHRCGLAVTCPNCSVALTFHKGRTQLLCHYCDHQQGVPKVCPQCRQLSLGAFGPGAERLELEARERFAPARVARLDRDAVTGADAPNAEEILGAFARREVDILVGTQMAAKGHHFPALSVVGVVMAETALIQPDFRAAERTFQMLAQVAGRAGRGEIPGRVLVQCLDPNHYAIQAAARHDLAAFAARELPFRHQAGYPPFVRLGLLQFSTPNQAAGEAMARLLREGKPEQAGVSYLGPAPAPLFKLRNRFRWQVLVKETQPGCLHQGLKALWLAAQPLAGHAIRLEVDVDPQFLA